MRLWDLDKLREPDSFDAPGGLIFGLDFSADGKELLTGSSREWKAGVWDVASGRQLKKLATRHRGDSLLFSARRHAGADCPGLRRRAPTLRPTKRGGAAASG